VLYQDQFRAGSNVRRLEWIDALRGYAIIGVVSGHLADGLPNGARGVQLFFIVSAVALLYSWHSRNDGVTPFFIRRVFRIAPMFWLAIPVFFWLSPHSPDQVISAALFVHWASPSWQNMAVPGSWSIGCEVLFYAAFPVLVTYIDTFNKSMLAFIASVIVAAAAWPMLNAYAAHMGVASVLMQHTFAFLFVTTQFPCFMIGFCVYYATQRQWPQWLTEIGAFVGFLFLIGGAVFQIQSSAFYLGYCIAFGLIAHALAAGKLRVLSNRVIVFIGLISYSAYFSHFFWIAWLERMTPSLSRVAFDAIALALTVGSSFLTYRLIERPMIKLGGMLARPYAKLRVS
jgi:peptidoglycan/LPS O-acetylase OafA/YrhL